MPNLKPSENSHGASKITKKFSLIQRMKAITHASRGLWIFLKTTHSAWIQIAIFFCVIILGFYFKISSTEWLAIVLGGGMVIMAEAFNTAIEIDMDLTSPTYHPYARDTKDVAAGAVLISAILAIIIGVIIFVPYIKIWLSK